MKRQIHLLALLLIAAIAYGQHPKNGGFEIWNGNVPADWQFVDSSGTVSTYPGYVGTYSVNLGSISDGMLAFKGGIIKQTDTLPWRPFSLTGFRKGTGVLTLRIFDLAHNEMGSVRKSFDHVAWQPFQDTIQWSGSATQFVATIQLETEPITGPTDANFDTLAFRPDLSSNIENHAVDNRPHLFPNPAGNYFHYQGYAGGSISLYNLQGQLLMQHETENNNGVIDVSPYRGKTLLVVFKNGNAFYRAEPLMVE